MLTPSIVSNAEEEGGSHGRRKVRLFENCSQGTLLVPLFLKKHFCNLLKYELQYLEGIGVFGGSIKTIDMFSENPSQQHWSGQGEP